MSDQAEASQLERKPPKLKERWSPKKWKPLYDQVVAMHCMGLNNKQVAERFGITDQHVCNILGCDKAEIVKELIRRKMNEDMAATVADRLSGLETKATKIIDRVLNDEALIENKPLAMFDRAVSLLKGIGKLESDGVKVQHNTINVDAQQVALLINGIEKSNEAMKLHAQKALPSGG